MAEMTPEDQASLIAGSVLTYFDSDDAEFADNLIGEVAKAIRAVVQAEREACCAELRSLQKGSHSAAWIDALGVAIERVEARGKEQDYASRG